MINAKFENIRNMKLGSMDAASGALLYDIFMMKLRCKICFSHLDLHS